MPIAFCRLSLPCDIEGFRRDLAQVTGAAWASHFNQGYHAGAWTGLALRGPEGTTHELLPQGAAKARFVDTPLFASCPAIRRFVDGLDCPVHSVRLLRVAAGGFIREHRDDDLAFDGGEARLHVPIATNPQVEFYLDGVRIPMAEGECWYLDFSLPHRVQNRGATDRVHLVIDCTLSDGLRARFPSDAAIADQHREPRMLHADASSSAQRLEAFRARVLADGALQRRLLEPQDARDWVERVVATARDLGYDFTVEDVRAASDANRRAWIERRMVR